MPTHKRIVEAVPHPDDEFERFIDDPAHVLVAEDDSDLRALMASALRFDGYHVIEAADGREFLDHLSEWLASRWPYEQLDVIVSDVRMPAFSGIEVVSSLRESHWDLPVILVTAFADHATYLDAKDLDVMAVIEKPFEIDQLRACVAEAVPRNREERPRVR